MGSDSYAASVSPTAINATVTVSQTPTITLLSASSNPVATGQPLTLLAQVLPNYTTGPVSAAANTSPCRASWAGCSAGVVSADSPTV